MKLFVVFIILLRVNKFFIRKMHAPGPAWHVCNIAYVLYYLSKI